MGGLRCDVDAVDERAGALLTGQILSGNAVEGQVAQLYHAAVAQIDVVGRQDAVRGALVNLFEGVADMGEDGEDVPQGERGAGFASLGDNAGDRRAAHILHGDEHLVLARLSHPQDLGQIRVADRAGDLDALAQLGERLVARVGHRQYLDDDLMVFALLVA